MNDPQIRIKFLCDHLVAFETAKTLRAVVICVSDSVLTTKVAISDVIRLPIKIYLVVLAIFLASIFLMFITGKMWAKSLLK